MNRPRTISFRILSLIFILFCTQACLMYFSIDQSRALIRNLTQVSQVELPATKALSNADMMHDGIRAVVLEGFYNDFLGKHELLPEVVREAEEKSKFFLEQMSLLESLPLKEEIKTDLRNVKKKVEEYGQIGVLTVQALSSGDKSRANIKKNEFDDTFRELEGSLENLNDKISADAQLTSDSGKKIVEVMAVVSVAGLVICLIFSWWLYKNLRVVLFKITERIENSVGSSVRISEILGKKASDLVNVNQEQGAAIHESVASLMEISSMISKTAENVRISTSSADEVLEHSEKGRKIMNELNESMRAIQQSNAQLVQISSVIDGINNKAHVINDIVFKTQLLSFNASIEAARAGQHGRGFAVVAEEVGNLADHSGRAAKEIEMLIRESKNKVQSAIDHIQDRVKDCDRVAKNVHASFLDIAGRISEVTTQIKSIGEATEQQQGGINQANAAMKQMSSSATVSNQASLSTAEASEKMMQECQELNLIVQELSHLVSRHKKVDSEPLRSESQELKSEELKSEAA